MSDPESPERSSRAEIANWTLRDFIASSPAAFIMFDRELYQIEASPRWRTDFGEIAVSLQAGQHFYDSYPDLPKHLRAAHRKALAGEITRAPRDRFRVKGQEVFCAWEVRPWGDPATGTGGIIVYAEHLDKTKPLAILPVTTQSKENPEYSGCPPDLRFPRSSLMTRGILWGREGSDALQKLLKTYCEMSCTCGALASPALGHQPNCPAHGSVPLISQAEQAIRRLCLLEELLRKDWTLIN